MMTMCPVRQPVALNTINHEPKFSMSKIQQKLSLYDDLVSGQLKFKFETFFTAVLAHRQKRHCPSCN